MATPEVVDFARLIKPISEELPSGVELKQDAASSAIYFQLKDARDAARTSERQIAQRLILSVEEREKEESDRPIEPPNWRKALELACDILAERSKDLWVASWAIEALARLHGFAGLRDGFRLTRELAETFWDAIHPRPDEDGYATTVAQLAGLNGQESEGALIAPIEQIPLTADGLTSAQYRDAVAQDRLDEFQLAVKKSPPDFLRNVFADICQAMDEFDRLNQVLGEKCGMGPDGYPAAPPSSAVSHALEECRDRMKSLAKGVLGGDAAATESESLSGDLVEVEPGRGIMLGDKKGMTREDAFRALLQVADYFRRSEPHSPVSYALEQAVRWGRMSLPDLLKELISDSATLENIFQRTGIGPPERSEGE